MMMMIMMMDKEGKRTGPVSSQTSERCRAMDLAADSAACQWELELVQWYCRVGMLR